MDLDSRAAHEPDIVYLKRVNIFAEQVRFLFRNATTGLIVNLVLAVVVLWVLWDRVPNKVLLYWFVVLMFFTGLRAATLMRFRQLRPPDGRMHVWCYAFYAGSSLAGLTWGATIWLFSPYDGLEVPVLLAFTLGGLMAGASAVIGAVLYVYFTYIVVIMLPITIWFLIQPGEIHLFMGMMLCVAIIAFFATGAIYRRVLLSSIMLSNDLIDAKAEAEIANAAKSEFLARMSHELRMPLSAIRSFAQSHRMDMAYSDVHRKDTEDVLKASTQLLGSIENLLDLAKIEARMIELHIVDVDCNELVAECIGLIEPRAVNNDIMLDYKQCPPVGITVRADLVRLKQILLTLLANACTYNHPGGSVTVSCSKTETGSVMIAVQDTGEGITVEDARKLLQSYHYRGHKDSIIEGSGLSLMIAKQLAEMMAGRISFDSTPGEGSEFRVELPGGR